MAWVIRIHDFLTIGWGLRGRAVRSIRAAGVVGKDGAAYVVGADKAGDAAFDHGNRLPVQPDIFADQCAGGLVVLCNPAPLTVKHRMDP